jgi:hypothetical protein
MVTSLLRSLSANKDGIVGQGLRLRRVAARLVRGTRRTLRGELPTPRTAMDDWLAQMHDSPSSRSERIAVFCLRNRAWVEWGVYAACRLRRLGFGVDIVYSRNEVDRLYPCARLSSRWPFGFWSGVARIPHVGLVNLDDLPIHDVSKYAAFARDFAKTVAAYDLHIEEDDPGSAQAQYSAAIDRAYQALATTGDQVETLLRSNGYHRIVVFSGLIDRTPAVLEAAKRVSVDATCVETWTWRPGHMICNVNAPALEYDVAAWKQTLGAWSSVREQRARELLLAQQGRQGQRTGLVAAQSVEIDAGLPRELSDFLGRSGSCYLLAPNVIGDSSTLRRATIFTSQREWIEQTIAFFRSRPHLRLVIRAHPHEVRYPAKVTRRLGDIASEAAAGAKNVFVVRASDRVNTYKVMEKIVGGLVWLSSAGADMVARGIPVIAAARPKYAGLGIVEEPSVRAEYFDSIDSLPARSVDEARRERAREYLSLVFSDFSYRAFTDSWRAEPFTLDGGAAPEAEIFYKVVAGLLPLGTPPSEAAQ